MSRIEGPRCRWGKCRSISSYGEVRTIILPSALLVVLEYACMAAFLQSAHVLMSTVIPSTPMAARTYITIPRDAATGTLDPAPVLARYCNS
jgi:hypothetical protein